MIFMPSTKNVIRFNEKCLKVLTMYNWQVGHDTTNNSHVFGKVLKLLYACKVIKYLHHQWTSCQPFAAFVSTFLSKGHQPCFFVQQCPCFQRHLSNPSFWFEIHLEWRLWKVWSWFTKKNKLILTKTYFIKSGIKVCPILKAAVAKAFVILGSISLL